MGECIYRIVTTVVKGGDDEPFLSVMGGGITGLQERRLVQIQGVEEKKGILPEGFHRKILTGIAHDERNLLLLKEVGELAHHFGSKDPRHQIHIVFVEEFAGRLGAQKGGSIPHLFGDDFDLFLPECLVLVDTQPEAVDKGIGIGGEEAGLRGEEADFEGPLIGF